MIRKKISLLFIVSLILIALVTYSLLHPGVMSFLILLLALLLASILMLLDLLLAWRKLTVTYRLSIVLCIVAWLGMFCGLIRIN